MSLWRDELKPAQATIACLIALAAVAVASFNRVIEGPAALLWAIAALSIGAAFAAFFGQRSLGVGFGLLVVCAVGTLPVLFVRNGKSGPVPTPGSLAAVRKLIASGFRGIGVSTPPVAPERKYLVLVWLALLMLGFLGAAWVVVRRPLGAVVSALAIVTFTGSVGEGPGRDAYSIAAIAATGAFFLAEGRHRIARWGGGKISIPAWLGVPTLAAACALALGAPILLGETPIINLNSAMRPRIVIIKPLSDIKRQLKVDPPLEVLRVTASQPTYWRLTGLDAYDGREWVLEAHPRDVRNGLVPQQDPPSTGSVLEQRYQLTSLLAPWLPAAYAATNVDAAQAVQVDRDSQTLLLRDKGNPGLTYTVSSRLPAVTVNHPEEPKNTDDPNARIFGDLAAPIVRDAATPLDKARRLEQHFRKYKYNEDVAGGHTVARLQQFLRDKAGYCEQFAATMTLMLRGLGVDARVGVGFLPGAISGGEHIVSTRDAHAWVEAKIPAAGWVSFDPTPGRGDASAVPPELEEQDTPPQQIPQVTSVPEPTPVQDKTAEDSSQPLVGGTVPVGVLWALLAMAIAGSIPTAKTIRRSRRRRGRPDVAVVGAYTELIDRARDLGARAIASETQREFVSRVLARDEHAAQLALLTAHALYGPGPTQSSDADQAWSASRAAHRSLSRRTPTYRRAIAVFDPRTFLPEHVFRRARLRVASAFGRA